MCKFAKTYRSMVICPLSRLGYIRYHRLDFPRVESWQKVGRKSQLRLWWAEVTPRWKMYKRLWFFSALLFTFAVFVDCICTIEDTNFPIFDLSLKCFYGSAKVAPEWKMTFDLDLTFEIMIKSAEGAAFDEEFGSSYLTMPDLENNQANLPIISS